MKMWAFVQQPGPEDDGLYRASTLSDAIVAHASTAEDALNALRVQIRSRMETDWVETASTSGRTELVEIEI